MRETEARREGTQERAPGPAWSGDHAGFLVPTEGTWWDRPAWGGSGEGAGCSEAPGWEAAWYWVAGGCIQQVCLECEAEQSACGEGAALVTWGWPGCGATLVDGTCVPCVPLTSPCLPRLGLASSCL